MSDEDDVRDGLAEIGLAEYFARFMEEGFDTWATVMSVTESDLDFLQVKLGHRRKLQSAIADSKSRSTPTLKAEGSNNSAHSDPNKSALQAEEPRAKRKYVRHPKPDNSAPPRALSAYVLFAHHIRDVTKDQGLSFTDMAKTVGSGWQALPQAERQHYEKRAAADKERYNAELAEYKKSNKYAEYQRYLERFKQEQENKKMRHEPPGVEKSGSAERMHPYRRSPPSTSLEASRPQRGSRDNSIGVANSPSTASPSSTSVTSPLRNLAPNGVSSQAGHQSTARTSQVSPAATTSTTSRNMVQDATSNAPAPPSATSSGINTTSPHHYFQSRGSDGRNDPPRYDFVGQEGVATRQLPPPVSSGLSRGDMAMHYNTRRNLPSAPNSGDYNNAFNSAGATYLPDLSAAQSHRTPHDYASALPSLRNVTTLQSRELQTQDPIPRRPIMSPHSGRMVDGDMTPPPRPAEAQNAATVEGHRNISDHRTQLPEPPGTAEALFDPAEPSLYPKQRLSEMRSGPRRSTRDRPN